MKNSMLIPAIGGAVSRRLRAVAAFILAVSSAFVPAAYAAGNAEAKGAIIRAEAKIDLISRETPAATQNPSFSRAHDRLDQSRDALKRGRDQEAEWLANEAELASDATASAAQLAQLERSRTELEQAVRVLESELRTK